jgi:hypothetical protein
MVVSSRRASWDTPSGSSCCVKRVSGADTSTPFSVMRLLNRTDLLEGATGVGGSGVRAPPVAVAGLTTQEDVDWS